MNNPENDSYSMENAIGFVALLISCVAFGFMFVPLKKFDAKDGIIFFKFKKFFFF